MENRNWWFSGYNCPRCGGKMIVNKHGHECGDMYCDYIDPENQPELSDKLILRADNLKTWR